MLFSKTSSERQGELQKSLINTPSDASTHPNAPAIHRVYQQEVDPNRNLPLGHIYDTRMTYCDVFFQLTRPLFYISIIYTVRQWAHEDQPKYSWYIGFLAAIGLRILSAIIFRLCFGLEALGVFDNILLYDYAKNKTIITAVLYFDKFDESMLDFLKVNMLKHRRMRSGFRKVLDKYYLKQFSK